MNRKWIILTEGHSRPTPAKTACSVIRYRHEEVVAVLDTTQEGKTAGEVLGVGGDIPFVDSLEAAPEANTLLIGIAVSGGKLPDFWRSIIRQAIDRGMDVVSGMHDFLIDDPEFAAAATASGSQLVDVRRNTLSTIARRVGLNDTSLRVLTVGQDCSVGKMVAAIEVTRELERRGRDAKFLATGQTGIMIEGDGIPIDCVVGDFMSGAIEQLVLANQQHELLIVEGQGSISHPSFSGVNLALLHGALPHGLILCYEVGRTAVHGLDHVALPSLDQVKLLNEKLASVYQPCSVIGVAMNSRNVTEADAERERERVREAYDVPVVDVIRHGAGELADAVIRLQEQRQANAR